MSIAAALLIGLILRLLLVGYYTPRHSWTGDPATYLEWGRQLAATGNYLQTPEQDKMPGMAALVAAGCLLGENGCKYVPLFLMAVAATAAGFGLWWLLVPHLAERSLIPALYLLQFGVSELVLFVIRLLPDLPALALGVGAVCALVQADRSHVLHWTGLAGLLLGASLYFRPDYMLVAAALAGIWGVKAYGRYGLTTAAASVVLLALVVFASLLPWGMRNQRLTGDFILASNHGERALWWAFNEGRHLDWTPGGEPWLEAPVEDQGKIARREAIRWMKSHPGEVIQLVGYRMISHVAPSPPGLIRSAANQLEVRWIRWLYRGGTLVLHIGWIVLGLAALLLARFRMPFSLALLGGFTLARLAVAGLYPDGGRMALIFVPYLACCAIWFFGRPDARPLRHYGRFVLGTFAGVLLVQILFVSRWGFWR